MAVTIPPWAIRMAQGLVLAGLAWLLWRNIDWAEAFALLTSANPWLLGAAALLLTVQTLLSALRWRLTAARLGIALPLGQAVREYYLSQVVNQSLPGGVVGDAGRAIRARNQAGLLASGQAVLFERIAGQIGLLVTLMTALGLNTFMSNGLTLPWGVQIALWVAWAGLLALAALIYATRRTALGRGLARFHHAVLAPPVLARQTALSLSTAACNITAFALCAAAVGATLPAISAAILMPMILFAMVLPLSISGWGLREGAAALLFPVAGLSANAGLAASIAFGVVFLIVTLPGFLMLRHRPDFAPSRHPEVEP